MPYGAGRKHMFDEEVRPYQGRPASFAKSKALVVSSVGPNPPQPLASMGVSLVKNAKSTQPLAMPNVESNTLDGEGRRRYVERGQADRRLGGNQRDFDYIERGTIRADRRYWIGSS